jgi:large subunit ribosomal protein L15
MKLHTLKNVPGARRSRMRIGRGEGSGAGKTAGSGHKGQWARKGHKGKEGFEGGQMRMIRRMPKVGFKNPARVVYLAVNISDLAAFPAGTEVTPVLLKQIGIAKGGGVRIKLLGSGDVKQRLTVKAHAFSASARAKVEAAGGKCEVVND